MVRFVHLESLAPHCCVFESCQGHWVLSCEEAFQIAYCTSVVIGSTEVPTCVRKKAQYGTHGFPQSLKAGKSLRSVVRLKTQHKDQTLLMFNEVLYKTFFLYMNVITVTSFMGLIICNGLCTKDSR